jgi:hypothetical protein
VRFERHEGPTLSLLPKQWTDQTASGKPAVMCPCCGGVYELEVGLGETHTVRGAGIVTPIVSCPYVCPFIEFVTLADWGVQP